MSKNFVCIKCTVFACSYESDDKDLLLRTKKIHFNQFIYSLDNKNRLSLAVQWQTIRASS